MIVRPVLIIGAPRSGTSLIQKILRNHPEFWSLPSESDLIWDQYCHPRFHNWESEFLGMDDISADERESLLDLFEKYIRPANYWKPFEKTNLIWGFNRVPVVRKILRNAYKRLFPYLPTFNSRDSKKRLLEKTASNCFRLGYVNEVFPDAKIIYPVRDGRNNVNSLINAWQHPTRFFTYDVPEDINLTGCMHNRWKFVLPPGWRDYTNKSLAELCAFQWSSCHKAMLEETTKEKYKERVLRVKLEDLVDNPETEIARIADFIDIPFDMHLKAYARDMPVVNSPDNDVSRDKWLGKNRKMIEDILPEIAPTMNRLGYKI